MSIITDLGVPGKIVEVSHEEVQEVGKKSEAKMTQIMTKLLERI
jgi:purine-nucleoside phosphorylase